jgi:NAD(P)H-hydrate repair Nnr-like enzyme with NAD(P)H-hydrate dehydratase domain
LRNPGLSSAGMGDILCGMIGAFIGQKLAPKQALLLAVYLHGAGADLLVNRGVGPIGLTASEVTDGARELINQWVYGKIL